MDLGRRRRGGASRISPASWRARCSVPRTLRSTIASSQPHCGSPPRRPAQVSSEHRAGKRDLRRMAVGSTASFSPTGPRPRLTWSCSRPAHGPAALPVSPPSCGRRCGRSRARCSRFAWTRPRRFEPRGLGARCLPGAAARWPPAHRRDGGGKGYDTALTAGGILTLLEAAWRGVPAIEELPIDEMWVGHRPGSRDDAPILGPGRSRARLCHRPSPQRHPADAGHRRRDRAARARRRGRPGDPPLRHRAFRSLRAAAE